MRIISLIASGTEMIHLLGLGHLQVGRSHECDYPKEVQHLPICTKPLIDADASSGSIDAAVKKQLANQLSIYEVNAGLIRDLKPDLIVTQLQCQVCAVSAEDVERELRGVLADPVAVVSLEAHSLDGIWQDLLKVAERCQVRERGLDKVAELQRRMDETAAMAPGALEPRLRVACLEWLDPLMCAGNWVPELVALAGGVCVFGKAGEHSPYLSWDELKHGDPDVIIAMPCGFDLERTRREMQAVTSLPGWARLRAVQAGRVYLCDGNQYMNRSGPRVVDSLEILAEILFPDRFAPEHAGTGWQPFE